MNLFNTIRSKRIAKIGNKFLRIMNNRKRKAEFGDNNETKNANNDRNLRSKKNTSTEENGANSFLNNDNTLESATNNGNAQSNRSESQSPINGGSNQIGFQSPIIKNAINANLLQFQTPKATILSITSNGTESPACSTPIQSPPHSSMANDDLSYMISAPTNSGSNKCKNNNKTIENRLAAINAAKNNVQNLIEEIDIHNEDSSLDGYKLNEDNDTAVFDIEFAMKKIMKGIFELHEGQNRLSLQISTIAKTQMTMLAEQEAFMQHAPILMEIVQKRRQKSGSVYVSKYRDLHLPWNAEIGQFEVLVNGVTNSLNKFTREEIKDEIIRCQQFWTEPKITINGKERCLKHIIKRMFQNYFGFIDCPTKLGIAVALFLWTKDFFTTNFMPVFKSATGQKPRKYVPNAMVEISNENVLLFIQCLFFIGGLLFVNPPGTDMRQLWAMKAREPIVHRLSKIPNKVHNPMPKDFIPLMSRNFANDVEFEDLDENYELPPNQIEDLLNGFNAE